MRTYQLLRYTSTPDQAYAQAAQKLAQEMIRVAGKIPNVLYSQQFRRHLRDAKQPGELEKRL